VGVKATGAGCRPARDGDRQDRQRGAAAVEHLGVIVIVIALVGVLVLAATPVGQSVAAKLCEAFGTECGTAGTFEAVDQPVTDADFLPASCMYHQDSTKASSSISIAFIKIGQDNGFIVQKFSDGTVRATVTDGGSVGASGGVGGKFDFGKLGDGKNSGADVDFGGNLKFSYGDTWQFDSEAEYEQLRGQLDDYLMQQEMLKQEGGVFAIKAMGGFVDPPKPPEIKTTQFGVEGTVNGAFGLREPNGTDANGKETYLDPNAGVNAQIKAGTQVIQRRNTDNGDVSWTYELSVCAQGGVALIAGGGSGSAATAGALTVTRDADGLVKQIVFQTTREVGAEGHLGNKKTFPVKGATGHGETSSTVVKTMLDVDDTNRATVDAWLNQTNQYGQAATLALPWESMVPDHPSDDPFQQLLYEQAKVSQIQYDNIKDQQGFDLSVKAGWKLGFGVSLEESTADAVEAQFLGAPYPDGHRGMVDDSTCVQ
jgi:hypothetical protein